MSDTYRLKVQITIERMYDGNHYSGERLSINEETDLELDNFMQVAEVLGKFNALSTKIKQS